MMRNAALSVLAALLLASLPFGPAVAATDLGQDVAGESCGLASAAVVADIVCGSSSARAGALRNLALVALPASDADRRASIVAAARRADPDFNGEAALRCDGKSIDANAFLLLCGGAGTGWPRIMLATVTPRGGYLADGVPGMIRVLQAAIAARSGISMAPNATAMTAIQSAFAPQVLNAGATDYARYQALVLRARADATNDDFAGSESAWREALEIQSRLFSADSAAVGGTLLELALQVSNQQRFDEADALFRRAGPIVESAASPMLRARLASYRALDAANRRNYADALKYAGDAVAARRVDVEAARIASADPDSGEPQVPAALEGELAHDLHVLAQMAMRQDDLPSAQAAAEEALYIVNAQPGLPLAWRAEMVSLMGEINARQGRVVVAERNFTDALAIDRKLFGDNGPTIAAGLRLARFYADEQLYPAAVTAYRDAYEALARHPQARALITNDHIVPFLTAATAPGGADRAALDAQIFTASQLPQSDVTGQVIARVAARRAAQTPALAEEVRQSVSAGRNRDDLRLQLAFEQSRTDDERDAAREKNLAASLVAAGTQSDALAAKLRTDFPGYAALAEPGTVSLSALQHSLKPREAFVRFVIGVRAGFVLVATHDSFVARPISATSSSLAKEIAGLRAALVPRLGRPGDFDLALAHDLYRALLAPVADRLGGIDHLVVVTDGDLASLPFGLLVTNDPGKGHDYSRAAWLVRQTAVTQIPSADAFMALRTAPAPAAPRPFLGVGAPAFDGPAATSQALNALASVCQQGAAADPDLLRGLPPLPETAMEVSAVGRDLGASPQDILLGPAANEGDLRHRALDQYAVLYFATHGVLPGELHCQAEPGLVLSPPAQPAGAAADGLLTASEIAGLKLNASLVVLSACNTAAAGGRRFGGGALEGLADSFFEAGAHAVLASHWEVPSAATASLMTTLFAHLAHDPSRDTAEALRQAQLRLIAQPGTAHPFDWAAFTLIGDGN